VTFKRQSNLSYAFTHVGVNVVGTVWRRHAAEVMLRSDLLRPHDRRADRGMIDLLSIWPDLP
jgi:hypothetical protein